MNLKKYLLIGSILFSNSAFTNSQYPLFFTKDEFVKICRSLIVTNAIRTVAQLNPDYRSVIPLKDYKMALSSPALRLILLEAGAILLSNVLFSLPRESIDELNKLNSSTLTGIEKQKKENIIKEKMFYEFWKNVLCSTLGSVVGGVAPSAKHLYDAYKK